MPYPLPLTRTEAYLAYKAGVIQQSDLKPSLAVPRNGIDAWLAYWTGLTEDYPKREDGTPHILQEEEAYIAYLCGVINEYPEKCLRRVGAYLRYLISARWGRPDHPLNREELYLSLIKTQFIPSGDPSSDIEIDGTAKAPFVDVKMYGDTAQQTYSGKNLLNYNTIGQTTLNGVTLSLADDGTITLDGTCSADNTRFGFDNLSVALDGTYTLSFEVISGTITNATDATEIRLFKSGYSGGLRVDLANTSASTTLSVSGDYVLNDIRIDNGVVLTNYKIKIQLEKSATATDFEPYVGGVPSPNPEYPQPIQTVTGRQVVNVTGKNRLRQIDGTYSRNGITATVNNGKITLNGTATAIAYIPLSASSDYYSLDLSGAYTLSATPITGVSYTIYHGASSVLYSTSSSQTKTLGGTYDNVRFQINVAQGTTLNNVVVEAQLEKGSTATTYEPYSSNDYEINLGKNLLDNTLQATTTYSGTVTTIDGSTWTVVKPSNGGISLTPRTDFLPVNIKAGESVTFSSYPVFGVVTQASVHYQVRCYFYDKDENLLDNISTTTTANDIMAQVWSTSYTPTVDVAYIKLGYYVPSNAGTTEGITLHLQLERGSEATSYAPYFTPIELCKLGDYQDYIYKSGGKWYVHKEVENSTIATLTGYNYGINTSQTNTTRVWIQGYISQEAANIHVADQIGVYKSNYFKFASIWSRDEEGIYLDPTTTPQQFVLRANKTTIGTNATSVETWLNSNPVDVCYVLATPTDTTITDTNLIAQLEALVSGGAENGTTYIKVDATDPNLPGLLYVEAPKYE